MPDYRPGDAVLARFPFESSPESRGVVVRLDESGLVVVRFSPDGFAYLFPPLRLRPATAPRRLTMPDYRPGDRCECWVNSAHHPGCWLPGVVLDSPALGLARVRLGGPAAAYSVDLVVPVDRLRPAPDAADTPAVVARGAD